MNITSISYVKLFPLGMYINEKIGVEVSLEAGEDAMLALDTARNLVHEYHEKNNPIPFAGVTAIADNPTIPNVQVEKEPPTKLTKEEKQKKCITDTTQIEGADGLKSFALLVKNNPHLQDTYDNQMELLTNKQ
jgi:hypothetical protein